VVADAERQHPRELREEKRLGMHRWGDCARAGEIAAHCLEPLSSRMESGRPSLAIHRAASSVPCLYLKFAVQFDHNELEDMADGGDEDAMDVVDTVL